MCSSPALAGVSCTLPFQLQNNQLADASQVMANYNAIITCLGNAALAGANNDITSLNALTTPIAPALGGTSVYTGPSVSTGSANAQVVAATIPSNFALISNNKVVFKAGFTNTAAMQLNVNSTGLTNVFRRTTDGVQALAGGEIIAGMITEVVFDGVQYQLSNNVSPFPVGTVLDTIAATSDPGFLLLNGSCQSTGLFNALWVKMGSPAPGACGGGNFTLPDARGSVIAMVDSGGSNRLNIVCGPSGTLGTTCGLQQRVLLQSDLPNVNPAVAGIALNDPGHTHTGNVGSSSSSLGAGATTAPTGNVAIGSSTTGITVSSQGTVRINGNVAQTSTNTVQPTLLLNKQIKY